MVFFSCSTRVWPETCLVFSRSRFAPSRPRSCPCAWQPAAQREFAQPECASHGRRPTPKSWHEADGRVMKGRTRLEIDFRFSKLPEQLAQYSGNVYTALQCSGTSIGSLSLSIVSQATFATKSSGWSWNRLASSTSTLSPKRPRRASIRTISDAVVAMARRKRKRSATAPPGKGEGSRQ